jgi:hypothetical protein
MPCTHGRFTPTRWRCYLRCRRLTQPGAAAATASGSPVTRPARTTRLPVAGSTPAAGKPRRSVEAKHLRSPNQPPATTSPATSPSWLAINLPHTRSLDADCGKTGPENRSLHPERGQGALHTLWRSSSVEETASQRFRQLMAGRIGPKAPRKKVGEAPVISTAVTKRGQKTTRSNHGARHDA